MSKQTVHHIIATLTPEAIEGALGVSRHSIRAARTKGIFPGIWYRPLKLLCDDIGIPCPLSAFYWRGGDNKVSTPRGDGKRHAASLGDNRPAISGMSS